MNENRVNTSQDSGATVREISVRARMAFIGLALFCLSMIAGGAGFANLISPNGDIVKIVAVALFVASMIALTLGMVGDTRRRR